MPPKEKGNKGESLIPWRHPEIGPPLKSSLLKLVIAKGIHLQAGKVGIDDKWRLLMADILKQPAWSFVNTETDKPIEYRVFKDQFKNICDETCALHGWGKHSFIHSSIYPFIHACIY